METHHIETPRTARFHTLGDAHGCREVWYLLHGYGQSAAGFLEECSPLLREARLLVAPEALSRFYLRGGQGPVGASWMTREDRELEIADYLRYLDRLALETPPRQIGRRCVLGFSQGAAAAWRWVSIGNTRVERLISWAGNLPPELDLPACAPRLRGVSIELVRGASDADFDGSAFEAQSRRLAEQGIEHECIGFEGAHRMDGETLRRLVHE